MRHIPEDELHAYLDQALSRSQCVEIESHLADCPACRSRRDGIAALRDRTTALLGVLVPGRAATPPFELIRARRAEATARRQHLLRRVAWAASVVAAVGAGWGLSQVADDRAAAREVATTSTVAPTSRTPDQADDTAAAELTDQPADRAAQSGEAAAPPVGGIPQPANRGPATPERPGRSESAPRDVMTASSTTAARSRAATPAAPPTSDSSADRTGRPEAESLAAPRELQVSSSGLPDAPAFDGLWRTVSWENAQEEAGGSPAHVDGLPVVQVQVQQATSGKPLMVVAQQLGSGEVIRTIEGPADDVSSLLRRNGGVATSPWPTIESGTAPSGVHGSIVTMLGDRILAISAPGLTSDSLAAIARKVNASRTGEP